MSIFGNIIDNIFKKIGYVRYTEIEIIDYRVTEVLRIPNYKNKRKVIRVVFDTVPSKGVIKKLLGKGIFEIHGRRSASVYIKRIEIK